MHAYMYVGMYACMYIMYVCMVCVYAKARKSLQNYLQTTHTYTFGIGHFTQHINLLVVTLKTNIKPKKRKEIKSFFLISQIKILLYTEISFTLIRIVNKDKLLFPIFLLILFLRECVGI